MNEFIFLLLFCPFIKFASCLSAEVNLEIPSGGFHRTLQYHINIENFEAKNCHVALYFEFPSSLYVNVDEISKLVRKGQLTACSVGEFNVELFAENAGTQNVTVCSRLIGSQVTLLTLPIHQRYHEARDGGGYVELKIPKPKLLIGCEERVKDYRVSKTELCAPCSDLVDKWREIPFNLHPKDFIWYAPVGDTSMLPIVTWVTNIIFTFGLIYVLWTLYKVNILDEGKKTKTS